MLKKVLNLLLLVIIFSVFAEPVLAGSGDAQGGGGIRFGAFTLEAENTTSGDLVVFGGPVALEENSYFDGDLTVFGEFRMEEGAALDGQLVVLGHALVAGMVDGDVFVAGPVNLKSTATIDGDLSVVGQVTQAEGATVIGEIIPIDESDWELPINIDIPEPVVNPVIPQIGSRVVPLWVKTLNAIARGVASLVVLTLLSLLAASLWPTQLERIGRTIEESLLVTYGTGLLTLFVSILVAVLLAITICLSPFSIILIIVVSLGSLMGWIAFGLVVGRRILSGLFNQVQPTIVLSAVVGTAVITAVVAFSQVFSALRVLLVLLLIPPAAGAVLLTRFGTMPYATTGGTGLVTGTKPQPSPSSAETIEAPPTGDTAEKIGASEEPVEKSGVDHEG
jgi:cytoskeletal protein CcmA (bactofilin family)